MAVEAAITIRHRFEVRGYEGECTGCHIHLSWYVLLLRHTHVGVSVSHMRLVTVLISRRSFCDQQRYGAVWSGLQTQQS
jgi:hypothetical protein